MLLLSSLLLAAPAEAAVPAWGWVSGQPVLFHTETEILTPRTNRYEALHNLDALAIRVHVTADTTCTPVPLGKSAWELTCTFAYVKVTGVSAARDEQAELDEILSEWSTRLLPTKVHLNMGKDGKWRTFDLEGLVRTDTRSALVNDTMRTLMQRVFAPFDLQLPPEGDDWTRGWTQKGVTPVLYLQTGSGTVGGADVKFTPRGEAEGLYTILMGGKASLSKGAALDSTGTQVLDTRIAGTVLWDMQKGMLAYRDFTTECYLTASSVETGSGAEYAQITALQRVDAFNADGSAPLPIAAQRAAKTDTAPMELPSGVPLVAFSELGMNALFLPEFPPEAKALGLKTATVSVRVIVGADGRVTDARLYKGYTLLSQGVEQALKAARFPVRGDAAYAVDVDVEVRSGE